MSKPYGAHTICLCSRLLFYSKCTDRFHVTSRKLCRVNITQIKSTSQIVAFLKWIVLTVKLNQMKMLKLRLPYLFLIMLRRWTSELKSATGTKSQPLGLIPCYLRAGKHFEPDCLPPMEATDILSYLVLETSYYTQNQFKVFRSLEAYNQMVSGFIASVEGHIRAIYTRKNKTRTVPFIRACLI